MCFKLRLLHLNIFVQVWGKRYVICHPQIQVSFIIFMLLHECTLKAIEGALCYLGAQTIMLIIPWQMSFEVCGGCRRLYVMFLLKNCGPQLGIVFGGDQWNSVHLIRISNIFSFCLVHNQQSYVPLYIYITLVFENTQMHIHFSLFG